MGPDGLPRLVKNKHEGVDNMYRLNVLTGGEDQIVNSKHKIYYKEKDFALLKEDNEIQKKVKEYLLLGGKITNCLGRLKDNN